ncbi:hypothetical protein ACPCSP_27210 [Streptomyces cinereoruber]|uniref:hypothetical protein n=1 Tax=Streptomyces cinereoruber TaxID=67260 RepID=UPI003C2BFCB8
MAREGLRQNECHSEEIFTVALVVSFVGTSPIPQSGAGSSYRIWQHKVDGTGAEIPNGLRMALALPGGLQVVEPSLYAGVSELNGSFLWDDPASGLHFVGRTATSPGSLTISFVAPARTSTGRMQLFRSASGADRTAAPFPTVPGGTAAPAQSMVTPAPGAPAYTGQPVHDFAGTLPYASELLGVYQPLVGWLGAQSSMSTAAANPDSAYARLAPDSFRGDGARSLGDEALAALAGRFAAQAAGSRRSDRSTSSGSTSSSSTPPSAYRRGMSGSAPAARWRRSRRARAARSSRGRPRSRRRSPARRRRA